MQFFNESQYDDKKCLSSGNFFYRDKDISFTSDDETEKVEVLKTSHDEKKTR